MTPYQELPDDDLLAFLYLEAEFRTEYEESTRSEDSNWLFHGHLYINKTLAAADELGIQEIMAFDNGASFGDKDFSDFLHLFQRAVEKIVVRMRIRQSRRGRAMSVGLDPDQKSKIHSLIEKIRKEIELSSASVAKKEKLYTIISNLSEEVSKARTGLERFADLARGLSGISREVAEGSAEPWWKWFKALMGIVDDAKETEPQLPKPTEVKRIEPPKKELPKPGRPDLDDEIPF